MSPFAAFILGLLAGWLVEWVIDWWYWRRKNASWQAEMDANCRRRVAELEQEVASYKNQLASLQAEHEQVAFPVRTEIIQPGTAGASAGEQEEPSAASALPQMPGVFKEIQGMTDEMARRLHEAGVSTLAALARLRPSQLRTLAADFPGRSGSEVEIIKQARLKSGMIRQVDDLAEIVGIGPVISKLLNEAGIFTFAELGALSAAELREIVGERIQRLANEEDILAQARALAEKQSQGG